MIEWVRVKVVMKSTEWGQVGEGCSVAVYQDG